MPAPISPSAGAFSSTRTLLPFCARPSAALKPPIPPPAIRMGELILAWLIALRVLRCSWSNRDYRRRRRLGIELLQIAGAVLEHGALVDRTLVCHFSPVQRWRFREQDHAADPRGAAWAAG